MLEHTTMVQIVHAKTAPINVRPALEVTPIAFLVQKVVLDLPVHVLMLQHLMMGQMQNAKTAPINVPPAPEVTPIAHLV